jgi:hypothetical protein
MQQPESSTKRFEANNIEWLQSMSTVRRTYSKEYTVGVTIVNEICCEATAIVVKYKETTVPLPPPFFLCSTLEYLFKPRQTDIIVCLLLGVELTNTLCFLASNLSTHEAWRVLFVEEYMRLGGKVLPSAHIAATTVVYSCELS